MIKASEAHAITQNVKFEAAKAARELINKLLEECDKEIQQQAKNGYFNCVIQKNKDVSEEIYDSLKKILWKNAYQVTEDTQTMNISW